MRAPGIQQMSLQIVFQELVQRAGECPEVTIVADANMVGLRDIWKLVEVFAVLIEHLNAVVRPIRDVDAAVPIDGNRVWRVELAIPRAGSSPGQQKFAVLIELNDARIAIAIADKEGAIRQPGDVGGALEMLIVVARFV